ncbi:putative ABC transporter expressed in the mitochondrial inner membrane [Naviculisporaceae sp. PSN 640]
MEKFVDDSMVDTTKNTISFESEKEPITTTQRSSFRDLFAFTRLRHVPVMVSALATASLVAAGRTAYAVLLGKVFEVVALWGAGSLNPDDFLSQITQWSIYFVILGVGMWIISSIDIALWVITGELRAKTAREVLFDSLANKPTAWYDLRMNGMASLMVGMHTQTRELQLATSQTLGFLICDTMVFFACIIVAFVFSFKLTLVMLATGVPSALILWLISRFVDPAIEGQKNHLSEASKHATAAITGIDLVKVYSGADNESFRFMTAIRKSGRYYLRQVLCNCGQMSYIKLWMLMLFVVGFFFAVVLVNSGDLTPGNALTTFYAALIAFQSVETLGPHWLVLAKGMVSGQLLKSLVHDPNDDGRGDKGVGWYRPMSCQGDIRIRDVTFAYPSNPEKIVLQPSNFHFVAGETTFVAGRSGSGKSTLGNLLTRFYQPQSGSITIDEHPIARLQLEWLRRNITLVQQSSVTFASSFIENVALGAADPTRVSVEEIQKACSMALLQSTISGLPDGIHTKIGHGGCALSGGQQQRLALARAKLRDPPVLILDEITSGLDPVSRTLIMDAIRLWRKEKTTIIITHEVAQIQDDEYVYVLENGSVVQEGFRDQLAQLPSGLFSSLLASADDGCSSPSTSVYSSDIDSDSEINEKPSNRGQYDKLMRTLSLDKRRHSGLFPRLARIPEPASAPTILSSLSRSNSLRKQASQDSVAPQATYQSHVRGQSEGMDIVTQTALQVQQARSQNMRRSTATQKSAIPDNHEASQSLDSLEMFFLERLDHGKSNNKAKNNTTIPRTKIHPSLGSILRTVWPTLDKTGKLELILAVLLCLVVSASNPAFSFIFSQLLSTFWLPQNRQKASSKWAVGLTAVAVVDAIATFFSYYLMERVAQKWVNALRAEAIKRILLQPKAWFDKANHSPSIIVQCLERNAEEMRKLVGMFVPIFLTVTCMILTALAWALAIRWDLTLVTLAGVPVAIGTARLNSAVSDKWESICDQAATKTNAIFTETFSHIKVVRAFTLEKHFSTKHTASANETYHLGTKRALYIGIFYGLYQSIAFFLTAMVFYYAAKILSQGSVSTTDVIRIVNLLLFSLGTAVSLLANLPQVAAAKTTAIQMLYYANLPHNSSHESSGSRRVRSPLPIRMDHLRFAYPGSPHTQVLRNITLQIDPGTCTAIVGTSGCGKTTLGAILLRLYEPLPPVPPPKTITAAANYSPIQPLSYAGLFTTPPSELSTPNLRTHMSYVPQTPFLFPISIRQNILYGLDRDVRSNPLLLTQENVEHAAKLAGIHEFIISLAEGYDTLVGEGGLELSGGQKQRISIARALVRKPSLVVLDEPTSGLDADAAEGVRGVIRRLVRANGSSYSCCTGEGEEGRGMGMRMRMAVVVITHSKEMMRIADSLVVIEDGAVVETGKNGYDELLMRGGRFAALVGGGFWNGGSGSTSATLAGHGPSPKSKTTTGKLKSKMGSGNLKAGAGAGTGTGAGGMGPRTNTNTRTKTKTNIKTWDGPSPVDEKDEDDKWGCDDMDAEDHDNENDNDNDKTKSTISEWYTLYDDAEVSTESADADGENQDEEQEDEEQIDNTDSMSGRRVNMVNEKALRKLEGL